MDGAEPMQEYKGVKENPEETQTNVKSVKGGGGGSADTKRC